MSDSIVRFTIVQTALRHISRHSPSVLSVSLSMRTQMPNVLNLVRKEPPLGFEHVSIFTSYCRSTGASLS
jgi:hypothetical protein